MQRTKRTWHTVAEAARLLKCSVEDVEFLLECGDLTASIRLLKTELCYAEYEYDEDGNIGGVTRHILHRNGYFNIKNYDMIGWDWDNLCDLKEVGIILFQGQGSRALSISKGCEFSLIHSCIIKRSSVLVTRDSLNGFFERIGTSLEIADYLRESVRRGTARKIHLAPPLSGSAANRKRQQQEEASRIARELADIRYKENRDRLKGIADEIIAMIDIELRKIIADKTPHIKLIINQVCFWDKAKIEKNLDDNLRAPILKLVRKKLEEEGRDYLKHSPGKKNRGRLIILE